jgi:hypothetical protein
MERRRYKRNVYIRSKILEILVTLYCYLCSTLVKLRGVCFAKCGPRVMSSPANSGELRSEDEPWRKMI